MVVRYELAGMDLAEVRFAISPINELVLSLRAWRDPGRYPEHLPWLHRLDAARPHLDSDLLLALVNQRLTTPDFLIPRPSSPLTRIEDQLDHLARLDPAIISRELHALHALETPTGSAAPVTSTAPTAPEAPTTPVAPTGPAASAAAAAAAAASLPAVLTGPPIAVRARIVAALTRYWELCFAPDWLRIRTLLEADVLYRARVMAQHGLGTMLSGLESNVDFADNVVSIRLKTTTYRRSARGTGLTLVPALFTRWASTPSSITEAPMIHYGVRGLGTLWQVEQPVTATAIATLIGQVRANLLVRLEVPASSTELAMRLGVSVSAVNQHLRALREGGLLTSARYGRAVLYRRSALGDAFLGSSAPAGPGSARQ